MRVQRPLKDRAASGIKWRSLSAIVTAALQFVQVVVLARLLPPGDFGLFAIVAVVTGFIQKVSDLGIPNAVIQRERPTEGELSSLYALTILSGAAAFALAALLSPLIGAFYSDARLISLFVLYSIILLIAPVGALPYALLLKEMRFRALAWVDMAAALSGAIVSVGSALAGQGVYSFVWGGLISGAVTSLGAFSIKRVGFHLRASELRGYIGFGLYNTGEKAVGHLMWNIDKLIIGRLLGASALGYYSVAFQLITRPMALINPVVTGVSYPMFSLLQGDDVLLRKAFLKVIRMVSFLNAPVYLAMFAFSGAIVSLLFGPEWSPAAGVLRILALVGFLWSISDPAGGLFLAKGRAALCFWFNVLAMPVYASAVLVGVRWGITGAAWGLLAAEALIMTPVNLWLLYNIAGLKPARYIGACLIGRVR